MPKFEGRSMSPGPSGALRRCTNLTVKPSSDCLLGMTVRLMRRRTSARVAEPFAHALSTARATTSAAT
jgi:hypothetical protein